ncbi:hypothetical protein O6H91_01G048900 [Diphasiastrum complanatum]|uniref:Uncharacterized protein n=1 Tax=Diphasiastrum complanatum TaxID=34168 RepID=A0ACC2EQN8_DIPCM|nr:hypothetical protein O6H91_01G048900 [Diphasiastrum complanatum]
MGMGHGSHGRRPAVGRSPFSKSGVKQQQQQHKKKKGPLHLHAKGIDKSKKKKPKTVSIKNQIRSVERLLKKNLPREIKDAQEKRLAELKKEADLHATSELERKMAVRYRKVKFFERRKIERMIRRLEKQQRVLADQVVAENSEQAENISQQLAQLQEDLEYVRFFPKTEKYVSLFMGNEDDSVAARRIVLREKIKVNLAAAAATGVELEETGSEDDLQLDISEDDFFLSGKESGDADADDEWTDKSLRFEERKLKEKLPPQNLKPFAKKFKEYGSQSLANLGMNMDIPRKAFTNLSATGKFHITKTAKMVGPTSHGKAYSSSMVQSNNHSFDRHKGIGGNTKYHKPSRFTRTKTTSSGTSSDILSNGIDKARDGQLPTSGSDLQQKRKRKRSRPKKKK